ncbi:MAG: GumC family protein, partial [Verrucomicrobiales bacterium]
MNPPPQISSSGSSFPGYPTLDLEALAGTVRKRLWLIAGVFLACVSLAVIYVQFVAKKQYESIAVVYVEREQVLNDDIRSVLSNDFTKLDSLKSLERSIVSGSVILRTVKKLDLLSDPDFIKPKKDGESYSDAEIVELVSRRVKATLERGTRLIVVKVKDTSPTRARKLAETFVSEFEEHMMEQNLASAKKATAMLREQAKEQLERINQAEEVLQAFRESHPDTSLDEDGVTERKLNDLDRLLSDANNERLRLEAEVAKLDSLDPDDPESILEIGDYVGHEHIAKLLLARNSKRAEMVKIRRQYQPDHPTYIAYISDLEGLDQEVAGVARDVGATIRKRHDTAVEHAKQLAKTVTDQKRKLLSVDRVRKEFRTLKQQVDANAHTYNSLLARINETDVTEGVKESVIRMEQAPLVPSKPVSPRKKIIVGLAGVLGLMLGFGGAIGLSLLDRSLLTRRQIEQTLGLPVLAEIADATEAQDSLRES